MLGQEAVREFESHDVQAFRRADFDITNPEDHARLALGEFGPLDVIVNCSAYTAVDRAESERAVAFDVNGISVGYLATSCQAIGAKLIHVSTDFVFDGSKSTPYDPADPTSPLGAYGESKLAGELALADSPQAIVMRTSWLFGPGGACFPRSIATAFRAGRALKVVADQVGTPTYAPDLARMIRLAAENNIFPGSYHAAGSEVMSWHSFAQRVVTALGGDAESVAVARTEDWPTPVRRPQFSALDSRKLAQVGAYYHRSVNDSIAHFVSTLA
jgi:dTDP-4-dehydrorhamnose reductase